MKKFDKLFESRKSRALLFVGALIVALLLSALIFGEIDLIFPGELAVLLYALFSGGLFIGFGGDMEWMYGPLFLGGILGWIVYFTLMVWGVRSDELIISKRLFFVFVFLLFLNVIAYYQ